MAMSNNQRVNQSIDLDQPLAPVARRQDARILAISDSEKRKADCVLSSVVLLAANITLPKQQTAVIMDV